MCYSEPGLDSLILVRFSGVSNDDTLWRKREKCVEYFVFNNLMLAKDFFTDIVPRYNIKRTQRTVIIYDK